ncbi:hypothetical protein J2Y60_003920 [Arcicella sp. BE140]|nr:hypothetical protein [Arcicella sp. BE51]MDR6813708.1 hypothetical protein [Arcicella sp. BE140]MDR6825020.1 hypothetical protein [Arcicella sp. BE139]
MKISIRLDKTSELIFNNNNKGKNAWTGVLGYLLINMYFTFGNV